VRERARESERKSERECEKRARESVREAACTFFEKVSHSSSTIPFSSSADISPDLIPTEISITPQT
jgi:hypothetical protein